MMRDKFIFIALGIWYVTVTTFISAVVIFGILYSVYERPVGYDCQLAEISPDMPLTYKEACRKERMKK